MYRLLVVFLLIIGGKCDIFERHLGTKTPYRVVGNMRTHKIEYEGCKPVKFWSLFRHGTRYPNTIFIKSMSSTLTRIRDLSLKQSKEPNEFFSNVNKAVWRKWMCKLTLNDTKTLTHEGEEELIGIGERMQARFPDLLTNVYSSSYYVFKHTDTQRAQKSAESFAIGLFGKATAKHVQYPEPSTWDPVLRFYKRCNKWRTDIKQNPLILQERRKFKEGGLVKKTINDVNQRFGFKENELSFYDIYLMYLMCGFETSWYRHKKSPWCFAFSIENLKVLEYYEDLRYYWLDGYAYELTYKQACLTFKDLMNFFESKEPLPKAKFYFSHSGAIQKFLAHIGLYKDEKHLLAADFYRNHNRKWRSSKIDSFATNLAFILFHCEFDYKILTMHQENIVRLPPCANTDLCLLKDMTEYYNESLNSCSFDEMCENL